ncbi:MAG: S9 family peptidase [Labilithrix sp.]|nr:S9 family peptidase [Labilithrix sp.]MCW5816422.1 S9 family peptidase [Labilithrix sp.]
MRSAFAIVTLGLAACTPAVVTPPPPAPPLPLGAEPAPPPKRAPVVAAAKRPVTRTYFDTQVTDDYEWLEDATAEETQAFTAAQTSLARATLDALPERATVRERVAAIYGQTSPDWRAVAYEGGRLFALKDAPPKQQPMLVDLGAGKAIDVTQERVVVDPNALDPTGKTTIDFFVPSPDGKTVAVSLSTGGTESGDVHLFDVATGKDRGETIARVNGGTAGGSVAWNADGTGFWYTRYPRSGERPDADLDFYQQVYFHKLGAPESADTYAIGKELPRIAEIDLLRSDDGKRILAHVSNGDGGEVEHHVLDTTVASPRWTRLTRFEDEMAAAAFGPDGRVYLVSRKDAPRGKVVAFSPPFDKPATDVLPEGDAVVDGVVVVKDAIYTIEIADGPSRMRRFPLATKSEPLAREPKRPKKGQPIPIPQTIAPGARGPVAAVLPLPPVSSVTGVVRTGDDLLVRLESYVEPPRWAHYRASEHRFASTPLAKRAAYDMNDVEVVRESCTSKDGTRVPMSVLRKKGAPNAPAPAYLTGYGGFGVTVRPRMRAPYRVWLDAGGVVAETNLRGGGERGEAWHKAGSLTNKQNVFDDFAACAKTLADLGYTTPDKLAISGRSNGGLLMGAALTQHPERYRAVAAAVGIYDMLRNELSPNGAFNVTEYGSVKDEAQLRALRRYSPFHNVKDDVAYPAVLFMTGANDPRVDPYHSRKMIARLQAATSSDRPVLLRASADTGHGMGTPLAAEIEEVTDLLTFLLHEVGAKL